MCSWGNFYIWLYRRRLYVLYLFLFSVPIDSLRWFVHDSSSALVGVALIDIAAADAAAAAAAAAATAAASA